MAWQTTLGNPLRAVAWWAVNRWVQRSFPEVVPLSTQSLANWLGDRQVSSPIVLDVRRPEEFAVSHLPTAQWVPDLEVALAIGIASRQPVVVYCSVGYRSARLGAQLCQAGYGPVYNLTGSLFQWANEGRSLVCQGQPATTVHPYSRRWGFLLRPDRRAIGVLPPADRS
jgi:rhodanese-related sulfurtransferase